MLYSTLPTIIYRDYPDFGYLTDNRNYGYDTASKSSIKVGELILSKTGSIFYSVLNNTPQSLQTICKKLSQIYNNIPISEIEDDANDFYEELANNGFIRKCSSHKDNYVSSNFSYDNKDYFQFEKNNPNEIQTSITKEIYSENRLLRVHLSISDVCNERCIHCYFPNYHRQNVMPKELFSKIIKQCKDLNVLNITLSGGEPMLNPHLVEFLQECNNNNFSINILSNLTLLSSSLVKVFENIPLLSIQTTLYSMDSNIHDSITKSKGSFKKTIRAIKCLHKRNIPMQINCPIMKQNLDTYKDVLHWAKSLNIEASNDYMLFGCFDGSHDNLHCRLSLSEIKTLLTRDNYSKESSNKVRNNLTYKSNVCPVCQDSVCISPLGDVYPCEGWQSLVLGNIANECLTNIWNNSSSIKNLRNISVENTFPKCVSCKDKDYCSICLIRNVNESKNLDFRDLNPYFCSIAKIKRELSTSHI